MAERGRLFVLDGPEGAGKSTQIERITRHLTAAGRAVITFRDPGTTAVGESIRAILLDRESETGDLAPLTELLLFMAARAQMIDECIRPALDGGTDVVLDRYYYATIAYQIHGLGADRLPANAATWVRDAASAAAPDRAWILDVPPDIGLARLTGEADRIERRERAFHERVRAGFRAQTEADPERVRLVDATRTPDDVFRQIVEGLDSLGGGSDR